MQEYKKDKKKKESEQLEKEKKIQEEELKNAYLDKLKNDERFQKYVVNGIVKQELDNLTDIRQFDNIAYKDLNEVGNLVLQANISRKVLERIFDKLKN